jgi:hypothetical protein
MGFRRTGRFEGSVRVRPPGREPFIAHASLSSRIELTEDGEVMADESAWGGELSAPEDHRDQLIELVTLSGTDIRIEFESGEGFAIRVANEADDTGCTIHIGASGTPPFPMTPKRATVRRPIGG